MDIVRRIVGAYLIAIAAVVGIFGVVEALYYASTPNYPYSPIWDVINYFTGLGCVLGVIFAFIRKRAVDAGAGDAVTWPRLAASVLFYGMAAVALLYLWNWFNHLNGAYNPVVADVVGLSWKPTDVAFPIIAAALGVGMLQGRATD